MSRELKRGNISVGSPAYFFELNAKSGLLKSIPYGESYQYHEVVAELAKRAEKILETVYDDYRRYAGSLRYFPENERKRAIDLVNGLNELAEFGSKRFSKLRYLRGLLELSSGDTRGFSNASADDIKKWTDPVVNEKYCRGSEQLELLAKATEYDVLEVSEKKQAEFLENVCTGKGRDQLKDMLMCAKYRVEHKRYIGRCGYELGSERYLEWAEKAVFRTIMKGTSAERYDDYKQVVVTMLNEIKDLIRSDVERGVQNDCFLKNDQAEALRKAVHSLAKLGVDCYNIEERINQMDWYVGGDPRKIRILQRSLNQLRFCPSLVEDGILDRKTVDAWEQFYEVLEKTKKPKLYLHAAPELQFQGKSGAGVEDSTLQTVKSFGVANDFISGVDKRGKGIIARNQEASGSAGWKKQKDAFEELLRVEDNLLITKEAYDYFEHFSGVMHVIKKADQVFAVAGPVSDALEAMNAVYEDLKTDGSIGKQSVGKVLGMAAGAAVSKVVLAWGGAAAAGAKIGALLGPCGALIGSVAVPLVLSLIGEEAASAFVGWVIDISELDEVRYGRFAAVHFR